MPNPWGPRGSAPAASTTTTTTSTTPSAATTTTTPAATGSTSSTGTPGSGSTPSAGAAGGLFGSSFLQDYMQQMMQNPRQMESILNTPYMSSMLQMMANNPEISRHMVDSNPQLAANPDLREQIMRSMPAMLQQVRQHSLTAFLCLRIVAELSSSYFTSSHLVSPSSKTPR